MKGPTMPPTNLTDAEQREYERCAKVRPAYESSPWNDEAFELLEAFHPIQCAERIQSLLAEVGRLRGIVNALPKTADGAIVTTGMELYKFNKRRDGSTYWSGEGGCISTVMAAYTGDYYDPHEQDWEQFYSTRDAALSALTPTSLPASNK